MRKFRILQSYTVDHPEAIEARSVDLIEDQIQQIADRKSVRVDRPPIGELRFKHFDKPEGYEVHAFFTDRHGKSRRFMKTREVPCHANDK